MDIKQLPKLHVGGREFRKRYLYVAIDRCSRSVHLAVKEDMTEPSATAFLREAAAAFPFRLTHVLTDRGSCFTTGAFSKACAALGAQHRTTKPYTPQTNGMAERFNGRIEREVLTITVGSHRDLERLLKGYNQGKTVCPPPGPGWPVPTMRVVNPRVARAGGPPLSAWRTSRGGDWRSFRRDRRSKVEARGGDRRARAKW
jgi:transposase InsO family protein